MIVYSENEQDHIKTVDEVFCRFRDEAMRINKDKSEFLRGSVKFLGRIFDCRGMSPSNEYAVKIQDWPTPNTGKQLRQFLGLVNYLHQFIPGLADATGPLSTLTSTPGRQKLQWSAEHQSAFQEIKRIARVPMSLTTPVPGIGYTLETDASNIAIGGVLKQGNQLVAVYSKKLNTCKQIR